MVFRSRSVHSANSRRRRLILSQSLGIAIDHNRPPSSQPELVEEEQAVSRVPADERAFPLPERNGVRSIPELLKDEAPSSWLFIGDSHTPRRVTESQPWMTYPTMFSATVRKQFSRSRDVFIDATYPGSRISEVLFEFERRVLRFDPDVCFLAIGSQEAESRNIDRFEQMIVRLLRWSKRFGCQLILQTPPCLPGQGDAELTRHLILVEAIRGISQEYDVLVVDHWEHWEWAATSTGATESWMDGETKTPGPVGHRQLARRMIRDLQLPELATMGAMPVQ